MRTPPRPQSSRVAALTAVAVVAALIATTGPAMAASGEPSLRDYGPDGELAFVLPDQTVVVHGEEVTLAQLVDLQLIARIQGISLAEAVDTTVWQDKFLEVSERLQDGYPDEFAGAAITGGGTGGWFAFRAEVPEEVWMLVRNLPKAIDLISNRGFSQVELRETLSATVDRVDGHPDVAFVAGGYDQETGVVTVEASPRDSLERAGRLDLASALSPTQPDNEAVRIVVTVNEDLEPLNLLSHLHGGGHLSARGGTSDQILCTWGFSVGEYGPPPEPAGPRLALTSATTATRPAPTVAG